MHLFNFYTQNYLYSQITKAAWCNLVIDHVYSNIFKVLYSNMPRHLLVHPHQVVLPVVFPNGVLLARLVVGEGVRVTEFVTGMGYSTIHTDVYNE